MSKGQDLYKKAKKLIPGGTQLLSKRPEMFLPDGWPSYYKEAKGCEVKDLDDNKYIDMSYMGIGSAILGYADKDVNEAVKKAIDQGNMCTLNSPKEVELAEILIDIHPWSDMVRYARTGGEAMTIAVRIARAASGKDKILFCGYHGWHDWYLSANLSDDKALDGHLLSGLAPNGVPRYLKGSTYPFVYNDTDGFLRLISKHSDDVGVIVLETIRNYEPEKIFLETIKKHAKERGIVVICDEITSGFRLNLGGAHLLYNFEPDIAVFAKGISNGYPMAAIIGNRSVMEYAQTSFISSTYWTESIGPTAAIATIKKMEKESVQEYIINMGKLVQDIWKEISTNSNVNISISGIYPLGHFSFNNLNPLGYKTLFVQEMLKRGILATNAFYASFAHNDKILSQYKTACFETFKIIADCIKNNNLEGKLEYSKCHAGFKRLT